MLKNGRRDLGLDFHNFLFFFWTIISEVAGHLESKMASLRERLHIFAVVASEVASRLVPRYGKNIPRLK